jgi:GxxExxY protein
MSLEKSGEWIDCPEEILIKTLDAAFRVHRYFGPGLFESIYEMAMENELRNLGCSVERQKPIPVLYRGEELGVGFRADLIVENTLIVEIKAVETLSNVHMAQIITYLKLLHYRRGYVINFNVPLLKNGIKKVSL